MAHLIKPCSMKEPSKANDLNLPGVSPRCFPPPIGLVGKNGKAAIPIKTRNGNKWEKTGKQESGFCKPFTGAKHD